MSHKNPDRSLVRKAVLERNVFIHAPQEVVDSSLVLSHIEALPKKFIDLEKIYTILSLVILEDPKGWKSINPNIELLEAGDEVETARVSIEISKRKYQIKTALFEEVSFIENDAQVEMIFRERKVERETSVLVGMIRQSKVIQDVIWGWVRDIADTEGGMLAVGENKRRVSKKSFAVIDAPTSDEEITEERIISFSFSVLRQIAKQATHEVNLQEEQRDIEIQRDEFVWASNPLISEFRTLARPIILEHLEKYKKEGVTEFDLVTQVMMHLATYEPSQVWLGNPQLIDQIVTLIKNENGHEAEQLFARAIESGEIRLNEDIAHYESERQVLKLAKHYSTLSVVIDGNEVSLPAPYMGNPELSPFKDYERTEVSAKNRQYGHDPVTGEKIMIVVEKYSGRKIIFKSVRPELSHLYSVGFSNLHYPRSGETHVFGAYLEGDDMPFAYSSYTPVVREYSRDMLVHLGVNPDNIMESARAWNSSWAPENTMSLLFSFAHEMMREQRSSEVEAGIHEDPLQGVFTSINPNLGFKAVSFRGVRFNVGGVKPTGFSYIKNQDGSADFMTKGEIKKTLGIESDEKLQEHPDFVSNTTPFLPTLEMITLFDIEDEKSFLAKPIYRVTPGAFNKS